MAEVTNFVCDVCGANKREANHWFRVSADPGIRFLIVPWDLKTSFDVRPEIHVCGMECACKAMVKSMEEK